MINPLWGHAVGVIIVVLLLSFIGTWIWAWHSGNKRTFDELARLPMNDEENQTKENRT